MQWSKKPTDPLKTDTPYVYSKIFHGNEYQIKADWEGDLVSYQRQLPFAAEAYAEAGNPTIAYVTGNYN